MEMIDILDIDSFKKEDQYNPCLVPESSSVFRCPIRKCEVRWEEKDLFNPAAIVRNGEVHLLYRAEDTIGRYAGTSRIGIARSRDGRIFTKHTEPVLYPDNDEFLRYEWEGGCEDPRIVEDEEGRYYMTYTAYDGKTARLFITSSTDLYHWTKHGPAFGEAYGGKYLDTWSKSGSIVCKVDESQSDRLIAAKIDGYYWMYWGESDIFLAKSEDLINWYPVEKSDGAGRAGYGDADRDVGGEGVGGRQRGNSLFYVATVRRNRFDSVLVEPGPPALLTEKGILFIYNSKNSRRYGDRSLEEGAYAAGLMIFDSKDPSALIYRTEGYVFKPDKPYEIEGQVNNVCFLEGLVRFKGEWLLYYGTADSKIALASLPEKRITQLFRG